MKCTSCGAENPDGMVFCCECGAKIESTEPKPGPKRKKSWAKQDASDVASALSEKTEAPKTQVAVKDRSMPFGVFHFISVFLLMFLPVINIVLLFRWAFSKRINLNLRNYSIAMLILLIFAIVVMVCLGFWFAGIYQPIVDYLRQIVVEPAS